jgi:cytochrome c oxidase subunit 1
VLSGRQLSSIAAAGAVNNPGITGGSTCLADWRELKFEREVWRSLDFLHLGHSRLSYRRKYYANFFEPASTLSKLSAWAPGRLIPGWAFITPYTSRLRHTAVGKVDIALVVVFMATLGSVFSAANYVITYKFLGAPLFKHRRELRSFFVDALLVASRMMLVANPALLVGIVLLLADRHLGTSTFDFSGGGDTILFQHLFWFFGHPEVYIIVIPCFGFMNSLLPFFVRKRLSGRLSLQFSMYTIAFMSFAVWGHHMYMVGLANSVRTPYSTMTVMISVPASTKVLHWCVTLLQATLVADVGFLFLLNFMYFSILGGLSGMFVAHIGFDTIFHDTFYVIGHFHVMMAGAVVSCLFGAFYFHFAAIFGVRYGRFFAYLHYGFYTTGQLLTLIPMLWLGYAGMPRRVLDYPGVFGGWHSLASSGHLLTALSLVFFLCMLLDSFIEGRAPASRTCGVGRLNTRLAFMAYETRKLQLWRSSGGLIAAGRPGLNGRGSLAHFALNAETATYAYTFTRARSVRCDAMRS